MTDAKLGIVHIDFFFIGLPSRPVHLAAHLIIGKATSGRLGPAGTKGSRGSFILQAKGWRWLEPNIF
jgi:hypothetical protein